MRLLIKKTGPAMLALVFCAGCASAVAQGALSNNKPTLISKSAVVDASTVEPTEEKLRREAAVLTLMEIPDVKLNTEPGAYQVWLEEAMVAPFDGVLLTPEAVSQILAEHWALHARAAATLTKQHATDQAVLDIQTGRLRVELEAEKEKSAVRLQSKDKEIDRLRNINKDIREDKSDFWGDVLLVGGSGAVGIAIGIVIMVITGG